MPKGINTSFGHFVCDIVLDVDAAVHDTNIWRGPREGTEMNKLSGSLHTCQKINQDRQLYEKNKFSKRVFFSPRNFLRWHPYFNMSQLPNVNERLNWKTSSHMWFDHCVSHTFFYKKFHLYEKRISFASKEACDVCRIDENLRKLEWPYTKINKWFWRLLSLFI